MTGWPDVIYVGEDRAPFPVSESVLTGPGATLEWGVWAFVPNVTARPASWAGSQPWGYGPDKPDWLAGWLLIIADNVMHVLCNAVALRWL